MPDIDTTPPVMGWTAYANSLNRALLKAPLVGGNPVDLTGATLFAAQVRVTAHDTVVAATGVVTTDVGGLGVGECTVEWDGAELAALLGDTADSWSGVWDLEYVAAGETQATPMYRGKFTVIRNVTNP